jgi:signal transduction histidine kinase
LTEERSRPVERRRGERRQEERERIRLFEQLIAAEQDERRRLALFLHDGAVQSLSGIALMLDAVAHAIEEGHHDAAQEILSSARDRQREAIRSLRDLSFNG